MDPGRLLDRLNGVLAAVENGFAAGAIDLPDVRYVHVGEPAYDCADGALIVAASSLFLGSPGTRGVPPKQIGPRGAVLTIHLYRCISAVLSGESAPILPTVAQFTADAETIAADGVVLFNSVMDAWRAGTLFEGCDKLSFVSMTPYGPDGNVGGWVLQIEVALSA